LRKRWQAVKAFAVTLTAIVSLSTLVCGLPLNITWFQECILNFSGKVISAYPNQSIDSFLVRLLTDIPVDIWNYTEGDWRFKLIRYTLFLVLISGTALTVLRSQQIESSETENLEFSSFLCLMLVISPISWNHYYLFLLLPISLYLGGQLAIPNRWQWNTAMTFSILLLSTPNVRDVPFTNPILAAFTRHFLVSHFFWGGILFLAILLAARWRIELHYKASKEN
jgi:hypothetical protein